MRSTGAGDEDLVAGIAGVPARRDCPHEVSPCVNRVALRTRDDDRVRAHREGAALMQVDPVARGVLNEEVIRVQDLRGRPGLVGADVERRPERRPAVERISSIDETRVSQVQPASTERADGGPRLPFLPVAESDRPGRGAMRHDAPRRPHRDRPPRPDEHQCAGLECQCPVEEVSYGEDVRAPARAPRLVLYRTAVHRAGPRGLDALDHHSTPSVVPPAGSHPGKNSNQPNAASRTKRIKTSSGRGGPRCTAHTVERRAHTVTGT